MKMLTTTAYACLYCKLTFEPSTQMSLIRAVAGQRSSPESRFANKIKMFFRAKTKTRKITGP